MVNAIAWISFMKIMIFHVQRAIFLAKIVKTNSLILAQNAMNQNLDKKILINHFRQIASASLDSLS